MPPTEGRGNHPFTIGGETSRALKGASEVIYSNRIPERLLRYLLIFLKKGTWFLDLCPGYQTNREVVENVRLRYIVVDIAELFKLGSGVNAKIARANIVAELLRRIAEEYGLLPEDLAFIWPPSPV